MVLVQISNLNKLIADALCATCGEKSLMFIQGRQEFIKNELKMVCIKCDFSNSNWMVNDGANQAFLTHMISCGLTPTKLKIFFYITTFM